MTLAIARPVEVKKGSILTYEYRPHENLEDHSKQMLLKEKTQAAVNSFFRDIIDSIEKILERRFEMKNDRPFTFSSTINPDRGSKIHELVEDYWRNSALVDSFQSTLPHYFNEFKKKCSILIAKRIESLVMTHLKERKDLDISSEITFEGYLIPENSVNTQEWLLLAGVTFVLMLIPVAGWLAIPDLVLDNKDMIYSGLFTNKFKVTPISG